MTNNNINTLTFNNHDTYVYYLDELTKSTQLVTLTPTNPEDIDTVIYTSRETNLFTNGVIKFNSFNRSNLKNPLNSTIITKDGILIFNFVSERNSSGIITTGIIIKTLATYKSGKYANYINVEIQIDIEDGYRILTISY